MTYKEVYQEWLTNDALSEDIKKDLVAIQDNETEIHDRFYKTLEFGTAGLRGKLGAGTNRMNTYMVGKAAQALANTIIDHGAEAVARGIAVSYNQSTVLENKLPPNANQSADPWLKRRLLPCVSDYASTPSLVIVS